MNDNNNENIEKTFASEELRESISKAMVKSQSGDASDELKESISKAIENKASDSAPSDEAEGDIKLEKLGKISWATEEEDEVPEASEKKSGKKSWSAKKKAGVTLGIAFLVFVILASVIVGLFFHYTGMLKEPDTSIKTEKAPVDSRDIVSKPDTITEEDQEEELRKTLEQKSTKISDENVMNILLIGEDIRDTATNDRGNTDVMMLISINKDNRTVTLTSLMRDMWVYMEEFNVSSKLNAAYWHGGAEYLADVIEDYFSITIDRTVKVNFRQFIDIVETVGGLDLEVSYTEAVAMRAPMDEQNKYMKNPKGTDYVDLEQYGKDEWVNYINADGELRTTIQYESEEDTKLSLHLNGNQSLAYARVRYGCGDDYGRTMRQRIVIQEIVKKSKKLSLIQLDQLMNLVLPEVETDLEEGEIAGMLLNAFDYMSYDIQQLRIPADGYYSSEIIWQQDCLSLRTWQFQANAAFLRYIVYGDCSNIEEAIEQYRKEINDGTFYEKNDFTPPVYW